MLYPRETRRPAQNSLVDAASRRIEQVNLLDIRGDKDFVSIAKGWTFAKDSNQLLASKFHDDVRFGTRRLHELDRNRYSAIG